MIVDLYIDDRPPTPTEQPEEHYNRKARRKHTEMNDHPSVIHNA